MTIPSYFTISFKLISTSQSWIATSVYSVYNSPNQQ